MWEVKFRPEEEVQTGIAGLRDYNRQFMRESSDLSCCVEDEAGRCIGGITAWRADELIYVDLLFVEASKRKLGLGERLLSTVEEAGRRQGAKRIELNTFGFQAPGFYEKLGYRRFGAIEPAIGAYGHYFYCKELE